MTAEDKLEFAVSRIAAELRPLVATFHERPLENGRKMRELLNRDRVKFPFAAARIFNDVSDEKGCRYLVTIFWTQDLLISLFVDVTIPQQLCLSMAQTAAKVDPHFHHRLSGFLQQGMLESGDVPGDVATRILEILSATMEPAAIAPLLRKILLHFDARVRSKATLLIGRGNTGVAAAERLLNDTDPRVRANAVEALWSNPDPRVIPIFLGALKDSNNRVLGNAILGLYYAGSPAAIPAAFELARHNNPVFRGTAAWFMGKSGDPRFLGTLGKLLGESTGKLRSIVFTALLAAKKSAQARTQSMMELKVIGCYADATRIRIQLSVADASGVLVSSIPPTAFIVNVGSDLMTDFSCRAEISERAAVAFVLPTIATIQSAKGALQTLLGRKPELEQWSIVQYSPRDPGAPAPRNPAPEDPQTQHTDESSTKDHFSVEPEALLLKLNASTPSDPVLDLFAAMNAVIKSPLPTAEKRHVIAVLEQPSSCNEQTERAFVADALSAKVFLHVLSPKPDAQMQRICASLSGSFHVIAPENIQIEIETLYDSAKSFYSIDFPAAISENNPSDAVYIQVATTSGSGKCQIRRPDTAA